MTKDQDRDVFIGAYDGYDWNKIKYLANSLDMSGFTGKKVMIVMNSDKETVQQLIDRNWVIVAFEQNHTHYKYNHGNLAPHVSRFYHIWSVLDKIVINDNQKPRYVITTDVRDVVFQKNPSEWIHDFIGKTGEQLIVASESLAYKNEPWGDENLLQCFGKDIHERYRDETIYNVGTFAGTLEGVRDMAMMIFQMSLNRPIPIVDQAIFNFLLWKEPYRKTTMFCSGEDDWAATLGTTLDPTKIDYFKLNLLDRQPTYDKDGLVYTDTGKLYVIAHQYDRVPGLKELVEKRYS